MVSESSFVFSFLTVQCHHERNLCKQERQGELLWTIYPLLDLSGTVETTRSGNEECRIWFARKGRGTQTLQRLPQCYPGTGGISHPSDHLGRLQDSTPQVSCVYILYWFCMAKFWYWGGYRGGFCEKLPGVSRVWQSQCQLQDGPSAGQSWAHQRWW